MAAFLKNAAFALLAALIGAPAAFAQEATHEAVLEALPPQPLDTGRCGLFLWSRDGQHAFVLVAYDEPAHARIRLNGAARDLPRIAFDGENAAGHFARQRFADRGLQLDLDIKFSDDRQIRDGAIVEQGLIRLIDASGWQSVHAVGGMVACKR